MPKTVFAYCSPAGAYRHLSRSSFARNTAWLTVGQGAGFLSQAVYFVLIARLLGSIEYGIFVGAFAFTSVIAAYSPVGTGTIFLRYVAGKPENFAHYFGNLLVVTTTVSVFLIAGLTLSAGLVLNPASAHLVLLASVANCLFAQITLEIGRVFQAFEKMKITAILNLLVNGVRTLSAFVLLLCVHRASAFQWAVVSTMVSGIAAVSAVVMTIASFGRAKFSLAVMRRHALEGFGYSFANSTASAYNDLDKTMLSHYGMNQSNGIYSMAYRIVDFATMPVFAIRDAALPKLFRRGREGIAFSAEYGRTLFWKSFGISCASSFLLIICASFIPLIVGPGFSESVSALRWLAIIPIFRSIHQMTGIVLTSSGYQGRRTIAQLTAVAVNVGLNLWLIPHFGWLGAAWASLATDGALALMNWSILKVTLTRHSAALMHS